MLWCQIKGYNARAYKRLNPSACQFPRPEIYYEQCDESREPIWFLYLGILELSISFWGFVLHVSGALLCLGTIREMFRYVTKFLDS